MNNRREGGRFPGLLILFTVIMLCVAVLSVLCVATVKADRAMAQRYGDMVTNMYQCESAGQRRLAELDAAGGSDIVTIDLTQSGWALHAEVRLTEGEAPEILCWTKQAEWEEDTDLVLWQEEEIELWK